MPAPVQTFRLLLYLFPCLYSPDSVGMHRTWYLAPWCMRWSYVASGLIPGILLSQTQCWAASGWGYIWREHRDHGFGTDKSQEASQTGRVVRRRLKPVCSLLLPLKEYISPLQLSEVFREYRVPCTHRIDYTNKTSLNCIFLWGLTFSGEVLMYF